MANVMYKTRLQTARDLIGALNEFAELCGRSLEEIYIEDLDMAALVEETLTDGSKVYNVELADVGPDITLPTR